MNLRRISRSRTTFLSCRKVEECRIFFFKICKVSKFRVFRSPRMSYVCDGLTNLRNCINYNIINSRCKSLAITVWLGSPLRDLGAWYLIYYRNLTKILEVGSSMTTKLINFSFRKKVQSFFRRDTSKLFVWRRVLVWTIRWRSVRWTKTGLFRILRGISFGKFL